MGLFSDEAATLQLDWDRNGWSVKRKEAEPLGEAALAFRLGVSSADLAAALWLGDYQGAGQLAEEMVELL